MKTCTKCGMVKGLGEFGKVASKKDWLRGQCKTCRVASAKAWRDANPEKVAARIKAWRDANREKVLIKTAKRSIRDTTGLQTDQIPPELIDAKCTHIKLTRLLRGMKNAKSE